MCAPALAFDTIFEIPDDQRGLSFLTRWFARLMLVEYTEAS